MTIYTLYIFDRSGTCRHYSEWNRKNQSGLSIEEVCIRALFCFVVLTVIRFVGSSLKITLLETTTERKSRATKVK